MKLADGREVTARRYRERDAGAVVELIRRNFLEVNAQDYGESAMRELAAQYDENRLRAMAAYANIYVFCIGRQIVGVGAISSFWGSPTESILLTIFVLPELHGNGIGRFIVQTLEQDELFLRADRIEIPASITAAEFYRKLGYSYKNGEKALDEENHYRMEKFRSGTKGGR